MNGEHFNYKAYLGITDETMQAALDECPYVFVYGSLKAGFSNHDILSESESVGVEVTKDKFYMTGWGFPHLFPLSLFDVSDCEQEVINKHFKPVIGELYKVDSPTVMADLDCLEGNGHNYTRQLYETEDGKTCWVYVMTDASRAYQGPFIRVKEEDGKWKWT